jgi:uncharacterized membrane protein YbhN (UPF0104 family)
VFPLLYVALLAAVSYGALALFSGGFAVPSPGLVAVLCALTLVDYTLKGVRWKLLLDHYGMRIGLWEAVKTYVAGLLFVVTPAKAGTVVKAELMKRRHGFARKPVVFVTVVERAMDITAHVVLGGVAAVFVASQYLTTLWAAGAVVALGLAVLYLFRGKLEFIREELEKLNDPALLARGIGLSLLSWGMEDLQLLLAVLWLGGQLTPMQAFFAFSASLVLGNVTFLPGGLGATEAGSVALLTLFGVGTALATTATLTVRFTTLWLGFGLGAVAWFLSFHNFI